MGSDRKSKEKEKIRKRSYSSGSEDEGKSKRHRNTEEDRKSKKGDKEKRKDRKSHKHRSDKDKKSKDKHRSKHHKSDKKQDIQELSGDDYFAKNNEFATWLKDEKDIFFSDLTTESARELFSNFVKAWNKGKLGSQYYEGIATGPRTAHNWKIK